MTNVFTFRQQERHLGIIKSLDAPTARKKHDVHSFVVNKDLSLLSPSSNSPFKYHDIDSSMILPPDSAETRIGNDMLSTVYPPNSLNAYKSHENVEFFAIDKFIESSVKSDMKASNIKVESWILATPTVTIRKREISDQSEIEEKEDLIDIPLEMDGNETLLFKREIIKPEQQPPVRVHIQNITEVGNYYLSPPKARSSMLINDYDYGIKLLVGTEHDLTIHLYDINQYASSRQKRAAYR